MSFSSSIEFASEGNKLLYLAETLKCNALRKAIFGGFFGCVGAAAAYIFIKLKK